MRKEVGRKGRKYGERGKRRESIEMECKSESEKGKNYTILINRLVYHKVMFIQPLYESYIHCQPCSKTRVTRPTRRR